MANKVLIVGGVAAGASAAAKARREDEEAEITIFEKGPYISFANCGLPYYLSGEIENREDLLVMDVQKMERRFNVGVFINHEVKKIDPESRDIEVKDKKSGDVKRYRYDNLVLAPGAEAIVPPLPGIDGPNLFLLRTIPDAEKILQFINETNPKKAVVVGGGFIGIESAEALVSRGLDVTLVEMLPQVLPNMDPEMAFYVEEELRRVGVRLVLGNGVNSFENGGEIRHIILQNGERIECDIIILAIGVKPNVKLAKEAGIEIGETGAIKVNGRMETSAKDIFAAGDAVESKNFVTGEPGWFALAGPANQQGRVAGANAVGKDLRFGGTLGTFIVRFGKVAAAKTGLSGREAQKIGYDYIKILAHPTHHVTYYPGASTLHMKLLAERSSGKLLGAQVVGHEGVDKRIDVLATAIFFGARVEDLGDLDLAYAPPFGASRDPINQIGLVGSHLLSGDVKSYALNGREKMFLDVRTPDEWEGGTIPSAEKIPINELRESLAELKSNARGRPIVPYCREGYRSYIAYRMLKQHGFDAENYVGGYLSYLDHQGRDEER